MVEHKAKDETIVAKLNKDVKTLTNVSFEDKSQLPITLSDEEIGVKAIVDWNFDISEFMLDINGKPFESHFYMAPNFNPDDDIKLKKITANVTTNQQKIMEDDMTQEWQPFSVQNALDYVIGDEPLAAIEVTSVKDTKADVLNELIGLFTIQSNFSETDFKLVLSNWTGINEPLDASIFETFT